MRATCVGTGSFTDPCTVGQQVSAAPGHTFFARTDQGGDYETHAMNMIWSGLKRGVWRFEVLPGGDGTARLEYRTFTVEPFAGG